MESNRSNNVRDIYNKRYLNGYRKTLSGYEYARWSALDHFITKILRLNNAKSVLDYGSGSGLYVDLWRMVFPSADLFFCDISPVSLEILTSKYPEFRYNCSLVENNRALFDNNYFDVVLSIEVMEHVGNLNDYLNDIHRLIKPGGIFVWTTPCANRFSVEYIINMLTKNIEHTPEGYRRWKWEDPTHLRRMRSKEIGAKLQDIGFEKLEFRFRAHFFSYVCTRLCKGPLTRFGEKLMLLDYFLFRKLPNGASMIGSARLSNKKRAVHRSH
jgi:SAM-dependent methyltransferase